MGGIPSVVRYIWASPATAVGFVVVAAGLWRVRVRIVDGVLEAHGPVLAWMLTHFTLVPGGAAALTLGHIVIGRDDGSLESTRAHERVHVRQYEAWGPLFLPAYLAASLSAVLRGRDIYFGNRFEVAAYRAERAPDVPPAMTISRENAWRPRAARRRVNRDAREAP